MATGSGRNVACMVSRFETHGFDTHEVTNQAGELGDHDSFTGNRPLAEAVDRHGGARALAELEALGARAGSLEARGLARMS